MLYGIVDLGSNTVRLNIYRVNGQEVSVVMSKKETVGLSAYVKNGQMTLEGIERASSVLKEFRLLLRDLSIDHLHVFATAALRNAKNSPSAVREIETRTGIPIQLLSGEEEAELSFAGASRAMQKANVPLKDGLMVDIGGGSTELVIYKNGEIRKKTSLTIGSLNMYENYVSNLLPTRSERKAIKQVVLDELKNDADFNYGTYSVICGIGGSIRAARKLNNSLFRMPPDNTRIKAPNMKKIIKLMQNDEGVTIPVETLDVLLTLVPDRVRTVVPGMIILDTLLRHFKSEWVEVTNAGVRDGFLVRHVLEGASIGTISETEEAPSVGYVSQEPGSAMVSVAEEMPNDGSISRESSPALMRARDEFSIRTEEDGNERSFTAEENSER